MIGAACCKMTDVWRKKNSSHIGGMSLKRCHWYQRGDVLVLVHAPDVNVALDEKKAD